MFILFEVRCNNKLLCISPTFRGAEKFIKLCKKQEKRLSERANKELASDYKIIEMELTI